MNQKFAFIGAGNMASAIIGGLTDHTAADAVSPAQITLFDKNPAQYTRYAATFPHAASAADAARGAADEARHAGHSNATIMRQSLQEDAQNRSTYHKSSRNLSYNRLVKFLTKTLNFT